MSQDRVERVMDILLGPRDIPEGSNFQERERYRKGELDALVGAGIAKVLMDACDTREPIYRQFRAFLQQGLTDAQLSTQLEISVVQNGTSSQLFLDYLAFQVLVSETVENPAIVRTEVESVSHRCHNRVPAADPNLIFQQ